MSSGPIRITGQFAAVGAAPLQVRFITVRNIRRDDFAVEVDPTQGAVRITWKKQSPVELSVRVGEKFFSSELLSQGGVFKFGDDQLLQANAAFSVSVFSIEGKRRNLSGVVEFSLDRTSQVSFAIARGLQKKAEEAIRETVFSKSKFMRFLRKVSPISEADIFAIALKTMQDQKDHDIARALYGIERVREWMLNQPEWAAALLSPGVKRKLAELLVPSETFFKIVTDKVLEDKKTVPDVCGDDVALAVYNTVNGIRSLREWMFDNGNETRLILDDLQRAAAEQGMAGSGGIKLKFVELLLGQG